MILVSSIYKDYVILSNPRDIWPLLAGFSSNTFRALTDISFNVQRGEVIGILGRNGSGKSTLLKILAGTSELTSGRVTVHGRVTAILEVSTGFNPLLSGRENIRRRLMLYGFSRGEIHELEPSIIEFSELEDVIDNKVLTYSAGMAARLAFSVVTAAPAEVVLIDELLMVGDEHFQGKCLKRILDLRISNKSVVLASHDTRRLERLCDRCILLEKGKILEEGAAHGVIMSYIKTSNDKSPPHPQEYARIEAVEAQSNGDSLTVNVSVSRLMPSSELHIQIAIHDNNYGILAGLLNTCYQGISLPPGIGSLRVSAVTPLPSGLRNGLVGVGVARGSGKIPGSVIEDSWGWDNSRQVYFSGASRSKNGKSFLGAKLSWKRCL